MQEALQTLFFPCESETRSFPHSCQEPSCRDRFFQTPSFSDSLWFGFTPLGGRIQASIYYFSSFIKPLGKGQPHESFSQRVMSGSINGTFLCTEYIFGVQQVIWSLQILPHFSCWVEGEDQYKKLEMAFFFFFFYFGKIGQKNNVVLIKWHKMHQWGAWGETDADLLACKEWSSFWVYPCISTETVVNQGYPKVGILECNPCVSQMVLLWAFSSVQFTSQH